MCFRGFYSVKTGGIDCVRELCICDGSRLRSLSLSMVETGVEAG
jgi:hypothetical protein